MLLKTDNTRRWTEVYIATYLIDLPFRHVLKHLNDFQARSVVHYVEQKSIKLEWSTLVPTCIESELLPCMYVCIVLYDSVHYLLWVTLLLQIALWNTFTFIWFWRIQACWRGYVIRKQYKELMKFHVPNEPLLRRRFYEKKVH